MPKTNNEQIQAYTALEANYDEMKRNRRPEDTLDARVGRKEMDKKLAAIHQADKESYKTPTPTPSGSPVSSRGNSPASR